MRGEDFGVMHEHKLQIVLGADSDASNCLCTFLKEELWPKGSVVCIRDSVEYYATDKLDNYTLNMCYSIIFKFR